MKRIQAICGSCTYPEYIAGLAEDHKETRGKLTEDAGCRIYRPYPEFPKVRLAEDVHAPYGAIIGDICGSIYEFNNRKTNNPSEIDLINSDCFFTDDTVLTVATADAMCRQGDYERAYYEWAVKYPNRGYGAGFSRWLRSEERKPYNSWGNGSAMRVSPIGWLYDSSRGFRDDSGREISGDCRFSQLAVGEEARLSAIVTHNHPDGIQGAETVALAIFAARCGVSKEELRRRFYTWDKTLDELRPDFRFDESCAGTVPAALIAFLESHDFVSAIQNAISIGGDSDTIACITGSIAEAFYKEIPQELIDFAKNKLPKEMITTLEGTDPQYEAYCTEETAAEIKKQLKEQNQE
ncbi:MAG: ADP-ribosylglycohydrolase family protein [Planctomycetaceae bacterium]|jgi:ADP-ribosylglycohydrolase|nr:ADP-ribosylglycohydrolase family protein [Planctomycetaceae bacterium]